MASPQEFNKSALVDKIIDHLRRDLAVIERSEKGSRAAATHAESKAENKYDTRGLEAGYLADGQARRGLELQTSIDLLRRLEVPAYDVEGPIGALALVAAELDGEPKLYFIVPVRGGLVLDDAHGLMAISKASPIGSALLGRRVGDVIELTLGGSNRELEVVAVA